MNIYRVNDVAKKLGISKQTLIRYEKKVFSLIPTVTGLTIGANILKKMFRKWPEFLAGKPGFYACRNYNCNRCCRYSGCCKCCAFYDV